MKILNTVTVVLIFISIGCTTDGPFLKPDEKHKKKYIENYSEIHQETKHNILKGKVILGMTKDEVLASWGKPDKIFPEGIPRFKYEPPPWNEQWLWKGAFFRTISQDCTVTFINNKVTNIQCDSFWGK